MRDLDGAALKSNLDFKKAAVRDLKQVATLTRLSP
jgi:hypothetical protein